MIVTFLTSQAEKMIWNPSSNGARLPDAIGVLCGDFVEITCRLRISPRLLHWLGISWPKR